MYDNIEGECPSCKKKFYAQTKLTDCLLNTYRAGDKIPLKNGKIGLKNACECGAQITMHMADGMITRFSLEEPDGVEGPWGGYYEPVHRT